MTTPAESPLAPSSGSSLLAIASSTPSSGPGPAQASKPGLAQPSPPTPRRTNPKTWFAKENVFGQSVSVKTFRSKRFGQNVSVKTFGQNLLAPKPLTISIYPKPQLGDLLSRSSRGSGWAPERPRSATPRKRARATEAFRFARLAWVSRFQGLRLSGFQGLRVSGF